MTKIQRSPRGSTPSANGRAARGRPTSPGRGLRPVRPMQRKWRAGSERAMLWGMGGRVSPETARRVEQLGGLRRDVQPGEPCWPDELAGLDPPDPCKPYPNDLVLLAVAAAHALPRLATRLPAAERDGLIARLRGLVAAEKVRPQVGDVDAVGAWRHQMLGGELPLALAYAGVLEGDRLKLAANVVSHGLSDFLDGDGQPHAALIPWMRPLLACWTRCLWLSGQVETARIRSQAREQFTWLVQQGIRWCRGDGATPMTTGIEDVQEWLGLAQAGVDLTGDEDDRALLSRLARGKTPRPDHQPDNQSDWACAALLRGSWDPAAACLAVTYPDRRIQWELSAGGKGIWAGAGQPEVRIGGRLLEPQRDWEATCWESDDDLGYLELEMPLSAGWRIQRQMGVVRGEDLLLVADVVLGPEVAEIDYRLRLPLQEGCRAQPAVDATEVELFTGRYVGRILPLALPEWQQDCRGGGFSESDATWHWAAEAPALYFPLVIDLSRQRRLKPYTWRRLTVAENLQIVPPHRACAYRVQIGKKQWVIYRTLGPKANRTFLGQNLSTEFYFGRFLPSGQAETLIEIE